MAENRGIELPMPGRRNSRQKVIAREEGVDVSGAVSYLEEAERGSIALTNEVRVFAASAKTLLEGGLTEDAVVALIMELLPKPHGRPAYSKETVLAVLKAASRLNEHLR